MRLIDVDELAERLEELRDKTAVNPYFDVKEKAMYNIALMDVSLEMNKLSINTSTVDADLIKRGRWVEQYNSDYVVCSVCGDHMMEYNRKYCPNCGAKMDLK